MSLGRTVWTIGCSVLWCLLALQGCNQGSSPRVVAHDSNLEWDYFEVTSLTVRDTVTLTAEQGGGRKSVDVTYVMPPGAGRDGGPLRWEETLVLGSWEFSVVYAYMERSAVMFLESGEVLPNTWVEEVESVGAPSESAGVSLQGERWLPSSFSSEDVWWCPETLALRVGADIVEFSPDVTRSDCDWRPLTRDAYDEWWEKLDARHGVMAALGADSTAIELEPMSE